MLAPRWDCTYCGAFTPTMHANTANAPPHAARTTRVGVLQPDASLYGACKALLTSITELRRGGGGEFEFHVYFPYPGNAVAAYAAAGCTTHIVEDIVVLRRGSLTPGGLARLVRASWRARKRLRALLDRDGIDVVHTNSMVLVSGAAACMAGLSRQRLPHVWHIRECPTDHHWLRRVIRFLTRHGASNVVAVSQPSAEMSGNRRTTVVHDGIALTALPATVPGRPPVFVMVGRISPTKGQLVALEAFTRVARAHADCELWIAGTVYPGHEATAAELVRRIHAAGVAERVQILGYVDDPSAIFRRASAAIVATTTGEGLCLSALEAMAAGCPVLAASRGGITEVVVDGSNGRLVPGGNVAALSAAMDKLLAMDAAAISAWRANARAQAERFTPQSAAAGLRCAYQAALTQGKR